MKYEEIVGIVDLKDTVGARRDMKHEHAIHAVKKFAEAGVPAT